MENSQIIGKEITEKINQCFKNENYTEAIELLQKALIVEPDNHWILGQLGISYYEIFNYQTALKYSTQAYEIATECQMVLEYHAAILHANGKILESKALYEKLLSRSVEEIAFGECGEGIKNAKSILNDARIGLADIYSDLNEPEKALELFEEHLKLRQRGVFSNLKRKEIVKEINELRKKIENKS